MDNLWLTVNVVGVVTGGLYLTYLHWRINYYQFQEQLFGALWDVTWETLDKLQDLDDTLNLIADDVEYARDTIPMTSSLVEFYRGERQKHIQFLADVMNCEADIDLRVEVEDE